MLKRLAELRKDKNWSMQETADRLGIAKSTYAGYESGYRMPSIQALIELADLYDTTVDYLLGREEDHVSKINLTELINLEKTRLYLDQLPISTEELMDFIAFTRVKREMKSSLKD
ncbi:HTH-type transcriptional regulator AnsR [Halalkalibacter wakoensis JCM 9140]|uniref:HTH-type transcriptional regulator AnsR n=1 Tax=Halalkalibacter wakoensis JCM 9140 TaxID=1236970 RepID=W4PZT9_9BACI|nr:helix-turn-helix transcriptional regulator [Halalkalibacter wakoensis]GAE24634.1 HTH-type transcriptional regulator AnsR [Halalkalibacter wakoensis JCM 9140]